MIILQKPTGLCFEKNIPDIILQKQQDEEPSVIFKLIVGDENIMTETYAYDANGQIRIRDLDRVVSSYLVPAVSVISGVAYSFGLVRDFTFQIDTGAGYSFTVVACAADMDGIDAENYVQKNFLTRLAREKTTDEKSREYLSYVHFSAYPAMLVKYRVDYRGSSTVVRVSGTLKTINPGLINPVATVDVSLSTIRTAANLPNEYIYSYDLWLENSTTGAISNLFRFSVDDTPYRNKIYFQFLNSFLVPETFTATGRVDEKKTLNINLGNIKSRYRKTDQDFIFEKIVNSGHLTEREMIWLDDFILSFEVGVYSPGKAGQVDVVVTSVEKTDTTDNVAQSFTFSYRKANNNHLNNPFANSGVFDGTFDQTFN
jgi:hypothetical protein